jgi:hypothetical protein
MAIEISIAENDGGRFELFLGPFFWGTWDSWEQANFIGELTIDWFETADGAIKERARQLLA